MHIGNRGRVVALVGAIAFSVGCDGALEDGESVTAAVKGGDNGTYLSATASAGAPQCTAGGQALVPVTGRLTTTASGAWASVTASVDGAPAQLIDEVQSNQLLHDGRTKTFDFAYSFTLANGSHTVQICFVQPSGQQRMTACATATVVVACETGSACANEAPFGETVGNRNMCSGNGTPNINIQAKGDFGETATLTVSGPNGFGFTTSIGRNGESCTYHHNWTTRNGNNGGHGTYSFTVAGNGRSVTWNATLFCP